MHLYWIILSTYTLHYIMFIEPYGCGWFGVVEKSLIMKKGVMAFYMIM